MFASSKAASKILIHIMQPTVVILQVKDAHLHKRLVLVKYFVDGT